MRSGADIERDDAWGASFATLATRIRADIAFAALDVFVVVASYMIALGIRMVDPLVTNDGLWLDLFLALPFIVSVHVLANILTGAYGHVWEHASTAEALRVAIANLSATAFILASAVVARVFEWDAAPVVPLVVIGLGGALALLSMGLVRFRSRLFSFHRASGSIRVLVVGVGREAVAFARAIPSLNGGGRRVVGFVAPDAQPLIEERRLAGHEILGHLVDLRALVADHEVDEVVVVGGGALRARQVVDMCLDIDVRLRILPGAEELIQDGVAAVDIRDIHVEDLLVRQPIETDLSSVRALITGRRVLVTGAGGSIGSEIVRQVKQFDPLEVWALDREETLLHDARLRWRNGTKIVLADVRDAEHLVGLFDQIKPEIVFHAAALKHVPLLEEHPREAVLTNVAGTRNVIEAGSRAGMKRFVLISTDKAVDPSSVMGATKRLAEMMTQAGAERADDCVYTSVRFGNVLGSRGSVIPTFVEQIKAGGPVTVTDREMTRYFMTVDEAVQLVLHASAMAEGTEIYVLDMGDPVRIEDLARRMIRLAGLAPGRDIEIEVTGRRPGEKMSEVLSIEPLHPTSNDKINEVRTETVAASYIAESVERITQMADGDPSDIKLTLNRIVDGKLEPISSVVDLSEETRARTWS